MWRTGGLIGALACIGLGVVHLRAEQTRCAAEATRLETQWVELRREWWSVQVRAARLRSPTLIRERVDDRLVDLIPPTAGKPARQASYRADYHP